MLFCQKVGAMFIYNGLFVYHCYVSKASCQQSLYNFSKNEIFDMHHTLQQNINFHPLPEDISIEKYVNLY